MYTQIRQTSESTDVLDLFHAQVQFRDVTPVLRLRVLHGTSGDLHKDLHRWRVTLSNFVSDLR
jgi:hypothetical protein